MRGHLTQIERDTVKLEEKEGPTPLDQRRIKRLKELAKEYDWDFEQCHVDVLNLIEAEDKAALDSEEAVFNEHVNHVSEIIERLEQLENLVVITKPVISHTSDKGDSRPEVRSITEVELLSQRLSQVQDSLMKIKRVAEEKETNMCSLEAQGKLKSINF